MISPLLMNVALHGLEEAAGVRYRQTGVNTGTTVPGTPILVRYADDMGGLLLLAATGRTRQGVRISSASLRRIRLTASSPDMATLLRLDYRTYAQAA